MDGFVCDVISSHRVVEVVGDDGHGHGDEHDAREGAAHADETAARRRRIEVACAHTIRDTPGDIGRQRGQDKSRMASCAPLGV